MEVIVSSMTDLLQIREGLRGRDLVLSKDGYDMRGPIIDVIESRPPTVEIRLSYLAKLNEELAAPSDMLAKPGEGDWAKWRIVDDGKGEGKEDGEICLTIARNVGRVETVFEHYIITKPGSWTATILEPGNSLNVLNFEVHTAPSAW